MIARILAVSGVALVAGYFAEQARADQYFVCKDGRAISVAQGDLEKAKRTNACVARHYGLSLAPPDPGLRSSTAPTTSLADHPLAETVELPARRPRTPELRKTQTAVTQRSTSPRIGKVAEADNSNYRRVRIINAQPGSPVWFHHKR